MDPDQKLNRAITAAGFAMRLVQRDTAIDPEIMATKAVAYADALIMKLASAPNPEEAEPPKPPKTREGLARWAGWTREYVAGNGIDAELWVSPNKKHSFHQLPTGDDIFKSEYTS